MLLNGSEPTYKAFEFDTQKACEAARIESKLPPKFPAAAFCAFSASHESLVPVMPHRKSVAM